MNLKLLALIGMAFVSCQEIRSSKTNCDYITFPEEINTKEKQSLYKEAMWQIYKENLLATEKFRVVNPFYVDSTYSEQFLYEFNLEFYEFEQKGDSLSFSFFFERGVSPVDAHYYTIATFWDNEDEFELMGRFGFVFKRNDFASEFEKYILLEKDNLSPSLKCLAEEKGILLPN